MHITRATRADLPAIQALMASYGNKMIVEAYHLNKRDIALQARSEEGQLIAFMWAGLMGNDKVAYIDKVAVMPSRTGEHVVKQLYLEAMRLGKKRGVQEVFGIVRHDQYHDRACINALKMGFGGDKLSYTLTFGRLELVLSSLEKEFGIKIGE